MPSIDELKPDEKEILKRGLLTVQGIDEFFHELRQKNEKYLAQFDKLIEASEKQDMPVVNGVLNLTRYCYNELSVLYTIIQISMLVQAKLKTELLQILEGFVTTDKDKLESIDKLLQSYQNDPLIMNDQKALLESIRKGIRARVA